MGLECRVRCFVTHHEKVRNAKAPEFPRGTDAAQSGFVSIRVIRGRSISVLAYHVGCGAL